MYPRNIPQSVNLAQHNLKMKLFENSVFTGKTIFKFYTLVIRKELDHIKNVNKRIKIFMDNDKVCKMIKSTFDKVPRTLKDHSANVLKACTHQCEYVLAQRLRRTQQMFCVYTRLWEERALKELIRQMRQQFLKKGKNFVLGAIGISSYNWEANRISDDEIRQHLNELDYIYKLKEKTICLACDKTRTNINTSICKCGTTGTAPTDKSFEEWTPFIEKNDLVVWRRLHPSGHFEYKVYGSYNDVSAEDFLQVQIDTDYRRKWDTTAIVLEVIEKDPVQDSNSDLIYWEMLWPKLFANRDYVFNRRYLIDRESKTVLIVSKGTEHPAFPKDPHKYRVEDYWSYMVIKPYTELGKPGIEFSLTYFDNPGVSIPSSVTTWVAMRAMPDFLEKLREATKKYKQYCEDEGTSKNCEKVAEEERKRREKEEKDKLDYCSYTHGSTKIKAKHPKSERRNKKQNSDKVSNKNLSRENSGSQDIPSSPTNVQKDNSYWKYLHPTYYFS